MTEVDQPPVDEPRLYTLREVCDLFKVGEFVVRRMIDDGDLEFHDLGTGNRPLYRFTVDQMQRGLERRRVRQHEQLPQ